MAQINLTDPLALVIGRLTIQVEEKTAIIEAQLKYIAELEAQVGQLKSASNIPADNTLASK